MPNKVKGFCQNIPTFKQRPGPKIKVVRGNTTKRTAKEVTKSLSHEEEECSQGRTNTDTYVAIELNY